MYGCHKKPRNPSPELEESMNRSYEVLPIGPNNDVHHEQLQHQEHTTAKSLNPSDYTFFPSALAAAFLCPAPPTTFNLNSSRCGKIDAQHPSPLFFQATGTSVYYTQ